MANKKINPIQFEIVKKFSVEELTNKNALDASESINWIKLFDNFSRLNPDSRIDQFTFYKSITQLSKGNKSEIRSVNGRDFYYVENEKTAKNILEESIFKLKNEWQIEGVDALINLLSANELERFLDSDTRHLIQERKRNKEENKSSLTKFEIATALIKINGDDLLFNSIFGTEIRQFISNKIKFGKSINFRAGSESAAEFVFLTGLPEKFVGRSYQKEDDFVVLKPLEPLRKLESYQKDCVHKILTAFSNPTQTRHLISMPTGSGKTRVGVESLFEIYKIVEGHKVILWLADSEELCEQAFDAFEKVWGNKEFRGQIHLIRYWGRYFNSSVVQQDYYEILKDKGEDIIVISTYQTLKNDLKSDSFLGRPGASSILANRITSMVIDEAHHSTADSYQFIIQKLIKLRQDLYPFFIFGLTATPFRGNGSDNLKNMFNSNLIIPEHKSNYSFSESYDNLKKDLTDKGILSKVKRKKLVTGVKLHFERILSKTEDGFANEYAEEIYKKKKNHLRQNKIVDEIKKILYQDINASIMYFGISKRDASEMNSRLLIEGIESAYVDGETTPFSRQTKISDFKNGTLKVLCNCKLLTTGFDAPRVNYIIIGRPTKSPVLLMQIEGRGLRGPLFGGSEQCTIIQVADEVSGVVDIVDIFSDYIDEWGENLIKEVA